MYLKLSFFRLFLSPVDEEALKKKITDELYKGLERDRAKAEQELQAWLDTHTHTRKHSHTAVQSVGTNLAAMWL